MAQRGDGGRRPGWPAQAASAGAVSRRSDRGTPVIRTLPSGQYRLYSSKPDPKTGRRRNLGTFPTRAAAERHERAVQLFKQRPRR